MVRLPLLASTDLARPEVPRSTSRLSPADLPALKLTVADDRTVESMSVMDREGAMAAPATGFSTKVTAAGDKNKTGRSLTGVMDTVTVDAGELRVLSTGSTTT